MRSTCGLMQTLASKQNLKTWADTTLPVALFLPVA